MSMTMISKAALCKAVLRQGQGGRACADALTAAVKGMNVSVVGWLVCCGALLRALVGCVGAFVSVTVCGHVRVFVSRDASTVSCMRSRGFALVRVGVLSCHAGLRF